MNEAETCSLTPPFDTFASVDEPVTPEALAKDRRERGNVEPTALKLLGAGRDSVRKAADRGQLPGELDTPQ